ncbi:MAG: MarR family transcriptional regulator [Deltaproteobacteria bacterium]|nr:MarR family transcriptional regulator [Deltaproteobacteria bacterium]
MADEKMNGAQVKKALNMWLKFIRAYSTYNKMAAEHLRSFGLTTAQYMVIECLGYCGPLLTGDLCKKTFRSGGNMTFVVDALEKADLVKRFAIEDDRRAIMVQLTPKGESLYEEAFSRHGEFLTGLAGVFSEEEQSEFARLLKKLGLGLTEAP